MNALGVTKFVATSVVGLGASRISAAIIKNNVPTDTLIDKITVTAASAVFGLMASEAAKKALTAQIDTVATIVDTTKRKIEEAQEAQK